MRLKTPSPPPTGLFPVLLVSPPECLIPFPLPSYFLTFWSLCPVRLGDKRLVSTHAGGGIQKTSCPGSSRGCLQGVSQAEGVPARGWEAHRGMQGMSILGSHKTCYGRFWGGTKSGDREGSRWSGK